MDTLIGTSINIQVIVKRSNMDFNKEPFREYMKTKQYQLNKRDEWIASLYGDKLTYNEITELRYIAIRQVLIKYNVEVITDIPWGKGLLEYRNNWEKMMTEAIENRRENCGNPV